MFSELLDFVRENPEGNISALAVVSFALYGVGKVVMQLFVYLTAKTTTEQVEIKAEAEKNSDQNENMLALTNAIRVLAQTAQTSATALERSSACQERQAEILSAIQSAQSASIQDDGIHKNLVAVKLEKIETTMNIDSNRLDEMNKQLEDLSKQLPSIVAAINQLEAMINQKIDGLGIIVKSEVGALETLVKDEVTTLKGEVATAQVNLVRVKSEVDEIKKRASQETPPDAPAESAPPNAPAESAPPDAPAESAPPDAPATTTSN